MGCNVNPGKRNMDSIRNTYIKLYNKYKNFFDTEFEFLFYVGDAEYQHIKDDVLYCTAKDDINSTFDKTIEALQYVINNKNFDYLVRTNISTYINIPLLSEAIHQFNKDYIYANKFNTYLTSAKYLHDVYPRGDAYIISHYKLQEALQYYSKEYFDIAKNVIDNCDDTLMGLLYIMSYNSKFYTNKYFNYYKQLRYNFLPNYSNELTNDDFEMGINCIFSRLKTIPKDEKYSDFSWEDCDARLEDPHKMKLLDIFISNNYNIFKGLSNQYNLETVLTEPQHRDITIMDFKTHEYKFCEWEDILNILNAKYSFNGIC